MPSPVIDPAEQHREIEETLLCKADELVLSIRTLAKTGDPERMDEEIGVLTELFKLKEFPSERKYELLEYVQNIQRIAYQLSIDTLLRNAAHQGRAGNIENRDAFLAKAKTHYTKALQLGADEAFCTNVQRRIEATLMTSGSGVDELTKKANAHKLELRDDTPLHPRRGAELRRAIRYVYPVLTVEISGQFYQTINWSARGLLLENYGGELSIAAGNKLKIQIFSEDLPTHPPYRMTATVVRVNTERSTLALLFPSISREILDLSSALKKAGLTAEPEQ